MNFLTRLFGKKEPEFKLLPEHFYYCFYIDDNRMMSLLGYPKREGNSNYVKNIFYRRMNDFASDNLIIGKTIVTNNFVYSNGVITKNILVN